MDIRYENIWDSQESDFEQKTLKFCSETANLLELNHRLLSSGFGHKTNVNIGGGGREGARWGNPALPASEETRKRENRSGLKIAQTNLGVFLPIIW